MEFMERAPARLRLHIAMRSWIAVLTAAVQLGAAIVTPFPRTPPYLPVPKGAAVIMRTGSTNTSGYRIVVQSDGSAEYWASSGRGNAKVPAPVSTALFSDLASAAPLQQLPSRPCMKSASFGTSLFVYWNHQRSGDLSCAATQAGKSVASDAAAVAQALHVREGLPGVMRPIMPGEYHRPLPTPS